MSATTSQNNDATAPVTVPTTAVSVISNTSIAIPKDDDEETQESFRLKGRQILVKVSHVNDVLNDLKTEVYDDEENEECHFVRIVRIGPETQNREATYPGALIVCQRRVGVHLDKLSQAYGETYYVINESDIVSYVDL